MKVERIIGTLKLAVRKATVSKMDQDWDMSFWKILGGHMRRPGTDEQSFFEFFWNQHRFLFECPHYGPIALKGERICGLKTAPAKYFWASRIVPLTSSKWPNKFAVRDTVLVRKGRRKPSSKVLSPAWYGPIIFKIGTTRNTSSYRWTLKIPMLCSLATIEILWEASIWSTSQSVVFS